MTDTSIQEDLSCCRTYATILITSQSVLPDEITRNLNIEPGRTAKKGDKRIGDRIHNSHMWKYSSQGELDSKNVNDHLDFLCDLLDARHSALVELIGKGCSFTFFVFWEAYVYRSFGGGPSLDARTMRRLVDLKANLCFDIYFDFSDEESDD